jgi:hypothetical protein
MARASSKFRLHGGEAARRLDAGAAARQGRQRQEPLAAVQGADEEAKPAATYCIVDAMPDSV